MTSRSGAITKGTSAIKYRTLQSHNTRVQRQAAAMQLSKSAWNRSTRISNDGNSKRELNPLLRRATPAALQDARRDSRTAESDFMAGRSPSTSTRSEFQNATSDCVAAESHSR